MCVFRPVLQCFGSDIAHVLHVKAGGCGSSANQCTAHVWKWRHVLVNMKAPISNFPNFCCSVAMQSSWKTSTLSITAVTSSMSLTTELAWLYRMSLSNSRTVSDFRCRWSCHRAETDAEGLENNFTRTPYLASPSRQIRYYLRARCSNIPQLLVLRQHHISCRIVMLRRRKLTIYARFLPRSETCCWTHFGPDPPHDTIRTNHRPDHTNVGIYFSSGAFLTNSLIGWIWCHWKYRFSSMKEGIPFFMTIPGSWGCRSGIGENGLSGLARYFRLYFSLITPSSD